MLVWVLLALSLAGGALFEGTRIADTLTSDRVRIEYEGTLSVSGLGGMPRAARLAERDEVAYASGVQRATMSVPDPSRGETAMWLLTRLGPLMLWATALALLYPLLRGARRGEPFGRSVDRGLGRLGALLLVGIPAIELIGYLLAESLASDLRFNGPAVSPTVQVSLLPLLPGLFVLVLAGAFRRGAELAELDAHTV